MSKPLVFISHITEEKELASSLKELIESAFLNMIEVFVSSDPTSIKLGRKWLDAVTDALGKCAIEIILASPESIKRPWINFEGGAGWIRDIPVIPLCHSGIIPSKLPAPLNALQGSIATDEAGLQLIFPVLADALNAAHPVVDFSKFIADVKNYEATSRHYNTLKAIAGAKRSVDGDPFIHSAITSLHDCYISLRQTLVGWEAVGVWPLFDEVLTWAKIIQDELLDLFDELASAIGMEADKPKLKSHLNGLVSEIAKIDQPDDEDGEEKASNAAYEYITRYIAFVKFVSDCGVRLVPGI